MPFILLQSQPPANLTFLFVAFAVTWLVFFVYAFFISRRRQELEREVRDMEHSMDESDGESGGGPDSEG